MIYRVSFGGHLLARSFGQHQAVAYSRNLPFAEENALLHRRVAQPTEIGKGRRDIKTGLDARVLRDGKVIAFRESGTNAIFQHDTIIEIVNMCGKAPA